jgi:hypothetical protein
MEEPLTAVKKKYRSEMARPRREPPTEYFTNGLSAAHTCAMSRIPRDRPTPAVAMLLLEVRGEAALAARGSGFFF